MTDPLLIVDSAFSIPFARESDKVIIAVGHTLAGHPAMEKFVPR
jgi:hypothetical protein